MRYEVFSIATGQIQRQDAVVFLLKIYQSAINCAHRNRSWIWSKNSNPAGIHGREQDWFNGGLQGNGQGVLPQTEGTDQRVLFDFPRYPEGIDLTVLKTKVTICV